LNDGCDRFAPFFVWRAYHDTVEHCGMPLQNFFDLDGVLSSKWAKKEYHLRGRRIAAPIVWTKGRMNQLQAHVSAYRLDP
jgi:hypothetical protein